MEEPADLEPAAPPRGETRPLRWLPVDERRLAASLLLLLVLGLVVGTNSLRIETRRASFVAQQASFGAAVRLAHLRWMASAERTPGVVKLSKRRTLYVSERGWPTIDPDRPAQDTARELWIALMDRPLGTTWRTGALPARGGGAARFTLGGAGGGSFVYDARDGSVRPDPLPERGAGAFHADRKGARRP